MSFSFPFSPPIVVIMKNFIQYLFIKSVPMSENILAESEDSWNLRILFDGRSGLGQEMLQGIQELRSGLLLIFGLFIA